MARMSFFVSISVRLGEREFKGISGIPDIFAHTWKHSMELITPLWMWMYSPAENYTLARGANVVQDL